MKTHPTSGSLTINKLFFSLIFAETSLVVVYFLLAYLGSQELRLFWFFDLNAEGNFPTWFSTIQLFAIGQVFLFKGFHLQENVRRKFLYFIGTVFIFLSADEAAAIHEQLTGLLRSIAWMPRFSNAQGIWIFIYLVGFLVFVFFTQTHIRWFLKSFPRQGRLIAIGCCFVALGAVLMEVIGYEYLSDDSTALLFVYSEIAIEEFLEMLGATFILRAALQLNPYPGDHSDCPGRERYR